MPSGFYALNEERACLILSGEDVRNFLQGMISNDIERLSARAALYAGFLTAQGRFLHDIFIAELADGRIAVDGEAERLDDLKRRLTMYKLRAKVAIADGRDSLAVVVLWGDDVFMPFELPAEPGAAKPIEDGVVFVDPRLGALGCRAMMPRSRVAAILEAAGYSQGPFDEYCRLRLSLGVPEGSKDMPVEKALVLESGFEELNGVDFKKGCYIGQELTARMKYRALVKKRLFPVEMDGPAPAAGTPVTFGGEEVGELRNVKNGVGLALLKLDAVEAALAQNKPLNAAGVALRPHRPAWFATAAGPHSTPRDTDR
ncbi:MAG TPA: folate-binding protein [Alphaproteobacteria bacterium]|nr:folate-binding protein [Alphaproteobacteria bacterium]